MTAKARAQEKTEAEATQGPSFEDLLALMARLRAPQGCPWDRAQTHQSLKGMLLEEACEVMAAIEDGDMAALRDELGDLLLHVAFHAQIASEAGHFTARDVLANVIAKVVRRHPHVFGEDFAKDPEQVKRTWERVKRREGKGMIRVGAQLPALVAARKLQDRAANAGLKLKYTETDGLASWVQGRDPQEAIGELLFRVVALARAHGVEPEWALIKFLNRLAQAHDQGTD